MKRFFALLILLASLYMGYQILSIWGGVHLYQSKVSKEGFLKAIRLLPSNPDPFYRLGLFYQWDLHNMDLTESLRYLGKAVERNPLEQEYWLNLGKVLQKMGRGSVSERALENAILTFPTGYRGRWIAGNLLLEQGALPKALPHFSYILANYPNKSALVFDVWTKVINDPDFILEGLVEKNSSSLNLYLSHLYEAGDTESAKKAWKEKVALGHQTDRSEVLRHIDFLASKGEMAQAYQIWKARLLEEGLEVPSEGDLINNGGFEREKILGGGFDWRMEAVSGTEISFDHSVSFEGKRSLRIVFNGKENVDFQHVWQFVPLKPDTEYSLDARIKTTAVTTKSGLRIEVLGVDPAFHKVSESLTGDNGWKQLRVNFRTPPRSQGGVVRLRRERIDNFDRFISGTAWIDNVRLTERH